MEMDEDMQESMQKIVEECLKDMDEQPSFDGGESFNDDQEMSRRSN